MTEILLAHQVDFKTWRNAAREHALAGTLPDALTWRVAQSAEDVQKALQAIPTEQTSPDHTLHLPRRLVEWILLAFQAPQPERFSALYRLLFRVVHEHLDLTTTDDDPDVRRVVALVEAVKAETERFRFEFARHFADTEQNIWIATPSAYVVEGNAAYCMARYARAWEVRTAYRSMKWDGKTLWFGRGKAESGSGSPVDWQQAGQGMWQDWPRTVLVPESEDIADTTSLTALGAEAMDCRACALWRPASRTVFGEGTAEARVMLVGEQPGDQEDLAGRPFVGPAGQVLDRALEAAGLSRSSVYVTNAVKHFRFTWRNGRRLHQKPEQESMQACQMWLDAERRLIKPALIVMMGVTAAQSLLHRPVTISRERSRIFPLVDGSQGLVTVHPSYLLRLPSEADKEREYARFVEDLRQAKLFMDSQP
ncbi:UdgX family uracil-DNA binding protein [Acetobacter orleanensis]|uniref:UdgX family uracil-DNA binding protein n=1 Tax=Acetobacter orleanensis TaxID=104099 RepID=UPI000662118C|nr:UdgX family uracil-DNA binding protein [Acetobacter orleanensis]KXV64328.1 DNA polymerase [Acetobacter orleanensis]PCD79151.1 uracil-DNA glycosylase [Acetobacter orleanensis]